MSPLLPRRDAATFALARRPAVDPRTRSEALALVEAVRAGGQATLVELGRRFGDLAGADTWWRDRAELERALARIDAQDRACLERVAGRIEAFAEAQRSALTAVDVPVPGGRAGHTLAPVASAGCYAPGGRFPLPSSVLMTAVTARVAGVGRVVVASPAPADITLAAAAIAGADGVLAVGGAQAIAALAYGVEGLAPVDFVCGPGNRWVTAAKQAVFGDVGVDMLAGPSELCVVADAGADCARVAADLLAQAEHDPDARPWLVAFEEATIAGVERELALQLRSLADDPARAALANGGAFVVADADEARALVDRLAPEHLELEVRDPAGFAAGLDAFGALFLGPAAGEVLGDYGAGPNHVLPTAGGARARGGLSVLDFLRVRTWLRVDDARAARGISRDAAVLARLEGLEAHARAAEARG